MIGRTNLGHARTHGLVEPPFAPSFDAFLAGLLKKGEKTPLENLSKIYTKANALHDKKQHAKVVALLEPALAQMPPTKPPKGLDALTSLPLLRRITSHGALGEAAIEAFRAKRPDVDVE